MWFNPSMKLTRKQKSAINKAAFRAGTYSRSHGCALPPSYSKPKSGSKRTSAMRESGSIFTAGEIDLIGDHGFDFINVCAGNTQNRIDEIMAENDYFDGTMDDMLDNQAKLTALYKRNKTAFKAIVDLPSSNNPRRRSRGRRR